VPQFTNFDPTPHSARSPTTARCASGRRTTIVAAFNGSIDEVEIFKRALTGAEVAKLANAGVRGKCKDNCYLPWDVAMCANATSATTNLTICTTRLRR